MEHGRLSATDCMFRGPYRAAMLQGGRSQLINCIIESAHVGAELSGHGPVILRGNHFLGSGSAVGEDGVRVKCECELNDNEFVNLARGAALDFRDVEVKGCKFVNCKTGTILRNTCGGARIENSAFTSNQNGIIVQTCECTIADNNKPPRRRSCAGGRRYAVLAAAEQDPRQRGHRRARDRRVAPDGGGQCLL